MQKSKKFFCVFTFYNLILYQRGGDREGVGVSKNLIGIIVGKKSKILIFAEFFKHFCVLNESLNVVLYLSYNADRYGILHYAQHPCHCRRC